MPQAAYKQKLTPIVYPSKANEIASNYKGKKGNYFNLNGTHLGY